MEAVKQRDTSHFNIYLEEFGLMAKFMTEVDSLDVISGGYDLENFNEIEVEKYKCAICKKPLKNAIQFITDSQVPCLRACR